MPGLFFVYFRLFKQTIKFLQQINVNNVHRVHGAGIRTHGFWNMSLLPKSLDHGSRPIRSILHQGNAISNYILLFSFESASRCLCAIR